MQPVQHNNPKRNKMELVGNGCWGTFVKQLLLQLTKLQQQMPHFATHFQCTSTTNIHQKVRQQQISRSTHI